MKDARKALLYGIASLLLTGLCATFVYIFSGLDDPALSFLIYFVTAVVPAFFAWEYLKFVKNNRFNESLKLGGIFVGVNAVFSIFGLLFLSGSDVRDEITTTIIGMLLTFAAALAAGYWLEKN